MPPRKASELEEMMLDELRHILLVLRDRMISSKNYVQFVGEIKQVIYKAERELGQA